MDRSLQWLHRVAEQRLLPLVCAAGLGVLLTLHAADAEIAHWAAAYQQASAEVEHIRIACGLQPDPEAVAVRLAAARQVQP